jgi:pimeloyl-ACP methyl ester carboxylesterase
VPIAEITSSPLAPGVSPVRIHYRDAGAGPAVVVLHGGWGYDIYPFDRQIALLATDHRVVIPDRSGYGGSGRVARQAVDFHRHAAEETFAVIAALGLEHPVVWGHSDGAVIALLMGLAQPDRLAGLIVEAAHFFRDKPASRAFFTAMIESPGSLGERVTSVLAKEHGEAWREIIRMNGAAWRRIADEWPTSDADLYGGRLHELRVPTLVIHGGRDQRTEPGELEALRAAMERTHGSAATTGRVGSPGGVAVDPRVGPSVRFEVLAEGGHSPHSQRMTADEVTRAATLFLAELRAAGPAAPGRPEAPGPPDPPGLPAPPAHD